MTTGRNQYVDLYLMVMTNERKETNK